MTTRHQQQWCFSINIIICFSAGALTVCLSSYILYLQYIKSIKMYTSSFWEIMTMNGKRNCWEWILICEFSLFVSCFFFFRNKHLTLAHTMHTIQRRCWCSIFTWKYIHWNIQMGYTLHGSLHLSCFIINFQCLLCNLFLFYAFYVSRLTRFFLALLHLHLFFVGVAVVVVTLRLRCSFSVSFKRSFVFFSLRSHVRDLLMLLLLL